MPIFSLKYFGHSLELSLQRFLDGYRTPQLDFSFQPGTASWIPGGIGVNESQESHFLILGVKQLSHFESDLGSIAVTTDEVGALRLQAPYLLKVMDCALCNSATGLPIIPPSRCLETVEWLLWSQMGRQLLKSEDLAAMGVHAEERRIESLRLDRHQRRPRRRPFSL